MEKNEFSLESIKELYNNYIPKYNLPLFSNLNEMFDIEEVNCETDFLLRKIRNKIFEKISGYLRFIEVLINPSNPLLFFYNFIKKLDSKDKDRLKKLYETFGNYEIEVISLDLFYSEQKEAEFIIKAYDYFNSARFELYEILKKIQSGEDDNNKKNNSAAYFG
jgi:hypothetical protein